MLLLVVFLISTLSCGAQNVQVDQDDLCRSFIKELSKYRDVRGLKHDTRLDPLVRYQAQNCWNTGHKDSVYGNFTNRWKAHANNIPLGLRELIIKGGTMDIKNGTTPDADEVAEKIINTWLRSPSHKELMLQTDYNRFSLHIHYEVVDMPSFTGYTKYKWSVCMVGFNELRSYQGMTAFDPGFKETSPF